MKALNYLIIAALALCSSSCSQGRDEVEIITDRNATIARKGFYEASYSVKENVLKVSVKKETEDPSSLLVVSVDETSDTIKTSLFSKDYILSKGSHDLSIESGFKIEGKGYEVYANSKTTTKVIIK